MSIIFTANGAERTGPPIEDGPHGGIRRPAGGRHLRCTEPFPHCDARVLHHPFDKCVDCNHYPALQLERFDKKIAFTGRWREGLELCPAEQARPLDVINRWGGNVAMTPERIAEEDAYWEDFRATLGL